jgi:hypothetical protein
MAYNVRDLLGHFVAPRSARGDMCPHSCCMNRRVHPENFPTVLPPKLLRRATDDELANHYGRHYECEKCQDQIIGELDRRDRVKRARIATGQRNKARALERHEHVEREILKAEEATKGYMLNAKGQARGISERSLFTGSEERAIRYASEELRRYWEDNPRPTAASMSQNYRVRREAYARSDLTRVGGYGSRTRERPASLRGLDQHRANVRRGDQHRAAVAAHRSRRTG